MNKSKLKSLCFEDFIKNDLFCQNNIKQLNQIKNKLHQYEEMQNNLQHIEKLANRHLFDLQYTEKWDDFSIEILMKEDTGRFDFLLIYRKKYNFWGINFSSS